MTAPEPDRRLLDAVVGIAAGLELPATLRRIVQAAADLTEARYAALGVIGDDGLHRQFVHTGMDRATVEAIGPPPRGRGVLGHITRTGRPVRVTEVSDHPASIGFPAHHPPMHTFLGVPVGIGDRVVGNLYLAEKPGGFTADDEDVVVALAAAAAVSVENSTLFDDVRHRAAWIAAAQDVTTAMLSGTEEDDALLLTARRARQVADADTALIVLPGRDGAWVVEIVDGDGRDLLGSTMPPAGRTVSVIHSGVGIVVDDMSAEPQVLMSALRRYGPALYAPLAPDGKIGPDAPSPTGNWGQIGALVLLRRPGGARFSNADLETAQAFAAQAALALELAEGRRRAQDLEILSERARIARDLHDLVVQELFALGIRLAGVREHTTEDVAAGIDAAMESLDRVVTQIRATVRELRDPAEPTGLLDRVRAETARARTALGFEPSLRIDYDADADSRLPLDVADDVVAVIREGLSNAARHARASEISVHVRAAGTALSIRIADNGIGVSRTSGTGNGLANLAERARRHGGAFVLEPTSPGTAGATGTTVIWTVPLFE